MKFAIFLALFFTQVAFANIYKYDLYYNPEKTELLDITVEVKLSGLFNPSSKVLGVKIWGKEKNGAVLLFNIPARSLVSSWEGKNLKLSMIESAMPLIQKEYIPQHSDTWINPGEEFYFENVVINRSGTLETDDEGFFLGNMSQLEMALSGFLKLSLSSI